MIHQITQICEEEESLTVATIIDKFVWSTLQIYLVVHCDFNRPMLLCVTFPEPTSLSDQSFTAAGPRL